MSLGARIEAIMAIDPGAPAIEYDGAWQNWGELAAAMRALAALLDGVAAAPGGRVGVLMRNHVAIVPAILEILRSGRCLVVLNPMLPAERLAADVETSGLAALVGVEQDL